MAKSGKPADLPGTDLLFGSHMSKPAMAPALEPVAETRADTPRFPTKAPKIEETEPVKFTFYFSPQLLEDLEVAKFRLRMEKRLKVSKSDIVNSAVEYALKDMVFLERLVKGEIR